MARKDKNKSTEKESSKIMTVIIALLIAIIWFAIFGFLIKLDVGGFGSLGVLRPIIKDVPIINKILPMYQKSNCQLKRVMSIGH